MRIADLIRDRGPLTVAAFMDQALYDPEVGYYARAAALKEIAAGHWAAI